MSEFDINQSCWEKGTAEVIQSALETVNGLTEEMRGILLKMLERIAQEDIVRFDKKTAEVVADCITHNKTQLECTLTATTFPEFVKGMMMAAWYTIDSQRGRLLKNQNQRLNQAFKLIPGIHKEDMVRFWNGLVLMHDQLKLGLTPKDIEGLIHIASTTLAKKVKAVGGHEALAMMYAKFFATKMNENQPNPRPDPEMN